MLAVVCLGTHGLVPQRGHQLHRICSIAGLLSRRSLTFKHNLVSLLLSFGECAAGAETSTSAFASGAFSRIGWDTFSSSGWAILELVAVPALLFLLVQNLVSK